LFFRELAVLFSLFTDGIYPKVKHFYFNRYTREAGVRSLDRKFGAICRAVAVKVAEGQHKEAKLDRSDVADGEGLWLCSVILSLAGKARMVLSV
jgi:hypothetical protein